MDDRRPASAAAPRQPLPALLLLAVLVILFVAGPVIGLCIVFRLARRAVPSCVAAWSADRAPPRPATVT